ncbi:MAG: FecR family protein [Hyphomicrobiaceae bacterium]
MQPRFCFMASGRGVNRQVAHARVVAHPVVGLLLFGLLLVCPFYSSTVQAQQVAGQVERQKGTANRKGASGTSELAEGDRVLVRDEIQTGPEARLQIRFGDQSVLTIGEKARITINQFVYAPNGESRQALAIIRGVFRFLTGEISKLMARNVQFTTPVATIGIRGTEFLGGELTVGMPAGQSHYGFQISEGAIEVISPIGSVVLDEPGEGTFLPLTSIAAPTPVRQWTDAESAEAEAALEF